MADIRISEYLVKSSNPDLIEHILRLHQVCILNTSFISLSQTFFRKITLFIPQHTYRHTKSTSSTRNTSKTVSKHKSRILMGTFPFPADSKALSHYAQLSPRSLRRSLFYICATLNRSEVYSRRNVSGYEFP